MLQLSRRRLGAAFCALALAAAAPIAAFAQDKAPIRVAFGDIAGVESLNLLVAIERAKERGVPMEITFFKSEDVAAQAVVSGQADIGIGTPYALMQKSKAPLRLFYRMSSLRFYPVVNTEFYKDWKDLDGQEVAVHSRGSGTEAVMNLMADKAGIKYGSVSYVPGSEVRAGALLQGNVKASIVDSAGWKLLQDKGGGKFKLLEMGNVDASDEALYANETLLQTRADDVQVFLEELVRTWREVNANPKAVADLRAKYGLLKDLPADLEGELVPYYETAVASKMFPDDGGRPENIQADFDFYSAAGQLQGEPGSLKVEDFWNFAPLEKALANVKG